MTNGWKYEGLRNLKETEWNDLLKKWKFTYFIYQKAGVYKLIYFGINENNFYVVPKYFRIYLKFIINESRKIYILTFMCLIIWNCNKRINMSKKSFEKCLQQFSRVMALQA